MTLQITDKLKSSNEIMEYIEVILLQGNTVSPAATHLNSDRNLTLLD
jgi:hypothetical protein